MTIPSTDEAFVPTKSRTQRLTALLRRRGEPPDLRDRVELLTERVVDEIYDNIPAFPAAGPDYRSAVRAAVERIVTLVVDQFRELRPATASEVNELIEICLPPTELGIALEDMLEVFEVAGDVLWWELHRLQDAGELAEPRIALELSYLGARTVTSLSHGVAAAYLRGDRIWLQRIDAERVLVSGLLDTTPSIEDATRAAHALGLEVRGPWRCVLVVPTDGTDLDELREAVADQRSASRASGAVAVHGPRVVLLLQDGDPPGHIDDAVVAVGPPVDDTQMLRTSYYEVAQAADIAATRGLDWIDVDGARLDRVLQGSLSARELADAVLADIDAEPEGRREMLLETLEAWLDSGGSPTQTGRALHLHVQSVRYRLTQLREVLGDGLDDPSNRLTLQIAVKYRRRLTP